MDTIDKHGNPLKIGMVIRVTGVPDLPERMLEESLPVFTKAVGQVFPIWEIDEHGHVIIEVDGETMRKQHSIALEPELVEIVDR